MKAALFWLCLFFASLASIEGHTLKKTKPVKYNFKLANRIETQQKSEKWKKETSKQKHIRCFVINISGTIRCSLVKKCPHQDPTCRTIRRVRSQTSGSIRENIIQKTSTKQKSLRSKCSDTKNPLCIHDIWVGKRSSQPIPKSDENMKMLCNPEDELCLLTIQRAQESPKMFLQKENGEFKTADQEEKMMMNAGNLSPTECDFKRDPTCNLKGSPETPSVIKDVLKRLQGPTSKRQKNCKGKPDKICRWRPQPNDADEDQETSSFSSSSAKDTETTARKRSIEESN